MAELKSYSCPKCGGFLDVDRDQDTFDCPFCGASFNVLDFHRDDLLEKARKQVYDGQRSQALEKYEYLLSKKPEDFDLLYEYACAIDGATSLKNLKISTSNPKNDHKQVRQLLKTDERFMSGPWKDYFAKLYDVLTLANKYHELVDQRTKIDDDAKKYLNARPRKLRHGTGAAIFGIVGIYFCFKHFSNTKNLYATGDIRTMWPFLVWFIILAGLTVLAVFLNIKDREKFDAANQENLDKYNELKEQSNTLNKEEVEPAHNEYKKALSELDELKPDEAAIESVRTRAISKKLSKSTISKKDAVCKKCGADLVLDSDNKLYVCKHCGVSYDYEVFVGSPVSKARKELMNGEFELAEKRFTQILEEDPGDFEANRGMLLCAGKWRALPDLRLNDKLKQVDWQKLEERLSAAKANANYHNLEFFNAFEEMLEPVKTYYGLIGNDDEKSISERELAEKSFKFRYKKFVSMDRKFRVTYQNKTLYELSEKDRRENLRTAIEVGDFTEADREYGQMLMNHPDDAEAIRARILCAGRWKSVEDANLDQKMSYGLLDLIDKRIKIGKENTPWDYHMYFELFGDLAELLRENFEASKDKESYAGAKQRISERFKITQSKLVELDKKLFDFDQEQGGTEG